MLSWSVVELRSGGAGGGVGKVGLSRAEGIPSGPADVLPILVIAALISSMVGQEEVMSPMVGGAGVFGWLLGAGAG